MDNDDFSANLVKVVAAQLYVLIGLQMARDMFGKGYTALGLGETAAVDQVVFGMVSANYHTLTPETLRTQPQTQQPVGVQSPSVSPKPES